MPNLDATNAGTLNRDALAPLLVQLRAGAWTRQAAVEAIWWARKLWRGLGPQALVDADVPKVRWTLEKIMGTSTSRTWRDSLLSGSVAEEAAQLLTGFAELLDTYAPTATPRIANPENADLWSPAAAYLKSLRGTPSRPRRPKAATNLPPSAPVPPIPDEPGDSDEPSDAQNLIDDRPIADADVYLDPTKEPGYRAPAGDDTPWLLIAVAVGGVLVLLRRRRRRR